VAANGVIRVVLELDQGEPLSGRIVVPTGPVQPFRGWLELAGKLARVRSVHGAGDSGPAASAGGDSFDGFHRAPPAS
jgi:hypothetical protein